MKNKVILLITLLAILVLIVAAYKGIEKIGVLSISQLQDKNNKLEQKINEASELTSTSYPKNIDILEETYNKYIIKRQKYEELAEFADENNKNMYETKQYDIGYIWRTFGKKATARNLTLSMNVEKNSNRMTNLYNLSFTVYGQYVNISQFIADLENNSDLYFRIYNFKMSGSGENISATFTVKNVNIDPSTLNVISK